MRQCLVKEVPNITVIVAWGSIQLIDKVSTVMFQLWHKPCSQHVQECFTIHGSIRKEVWAIHFRCGDGTKHICFRRIMFIFNNSVRLLSPPDMNILLVHFSSYMECSLITEPQPFRKSSSPHKSWNDTQKCRRSVWSSCLRCCSIINQ